MTNEEKDIIRSFIKRSSGHGGLGLEYHFYIPKHVMGDLTPDEILEIAGYPAQGYGGAREVELKDGVVKITSSAYCD